MAEELNNEESTKFKYKNIYLDKEHYELAEALMQAYRAPTVTHTIRLIIEDMAKIKGLQVKEADRAVSVLEVEE